MWHYSEIRTNTYVHIYVYSAIRWHRMYIYIYIHMYLCWFVTLFPIQHLHAGVFAHTCIRLFTYTNIIIYMYVCRYVSLPQCQLERQQSVHTQLPRSHCTESRTTNRFISTACILYASADCFLPTTRLFLERIKEQAIHQCFQQTHSQPDSQTVEFLCT